MLKLIGILLFLAGPLAAQQTTDSTPPPCMSPEASQFDFWVGDWQLTWADSGHGTNSISRPLGNCVIQEQFRDLAPNGLQGMSVSVYDPKGKQWQQTWVDNTGGYLLLTGGWSDSTMILSQTVTRKDGSTIIQRMVFRDITADSLTWDWQASTDDGKSWKTNWQIFYKRAK